MPTLTNRCDCSYCVDWLQPAGTHAIIGEVLRPCPYCVGTCPGCLGDGLFAADPSCLHCLAQQLAARNLIPVLCPTCLGFVDLIPLPRPAGGGTHDQ
jgi:hypothetical protein